MKKRIVIVEDHPIVRRGIVQLINYEDDLETVGEAESTFIAREIIERELPDLVLVDLSLKGGSGLELIKDIAKMYPDMKTIVVSLHDENVYAERVLRAGAKGYIMKSEATENILTAVRQVLKGQIYLSSDMQTKMLSKIADGSGKITPSIELLSDREFEVFESVAKGMTTKNIAEELNLSVKTIETYKSHIKTKLNINNSTELIKFAAEWSFNEK